MAGNLYEVHLANGQKYDVRTAQHHDDHTPEAFEKHLIDVVKTVASGVAVIVVERIIFKGKAPH